MIPAKQRRTTRDKLQQQRSRNGRLWEEDLCAELNAAPASWARCWPKAWAGQPFDISALVQGMPLGIECKAIRREEPPTVAYIPWFTVREAILAGDRGSIPVGSAPHTLHDALKQYKGVAP